MRTGESVEHGSRGTTGGRPARPRRSRETSLAVSYGTMMIPGSLTTEQLLPPLSQSEAV